LESNPNFQFSDISQIEKDKINIDVLNEAELRLSELEQYYIQAYNAANKQRETKIAELTTTPEQRKAYLAIQDAHFNESLEDFVTNKNDLKKIVEYNDELVQKQNMIYLTPSNGNLFDAHFYAPSKPFLGKQITTLSANILVIWLMSITLIGVLFVDGFRRSMELFGRLSKKLSEKLNLKSKKSEA
jgi:hypothetical protein